MQKLRTFLFNKRLWLRLIFLSVFYVVSVLSFVWWHCYQSGLTGGRNGPLDAYRHTLASAVVSYTTSPKLVALVSWAMERQNRPRDLMDQHNNAIGAAIGVQAGSLFELDRLVRAQIAAGCINSRNANQTTWREQEYWAENLFF